MSRIYFERLRGRPVSGSSGQVVGKVADCVVRLLDGSLPEVTGILMQLEGRDIFVSVRDVAELSEEGVRLASDRVDTRPFERRQGEVLLARDVVHRAVIDVVEGRLIRVADLVLEGAGSTWRVAAVVSSPAWNPVRTLSRWLRREEPMEEVEWTRVEPLTGHVPTAKRRLPLLRLAGIRPADIADIVEEASHEEAEEILEVVRQDPELHADVFEELDEKHQREFIRERSDGEAAALLAEMEPDDAADLLTSLEKERRRPILDLLPEAEREQVRRLLRYNPESAGGLMSTECIALPEERTVEDALEEIRRLPEPPETLAVVYTVDDGRLTGAIPLLRLLLADPSRPLGEIADRSPVAVFPDADIPSVAVDMADYNLAALPVVDEAGQLLGVITYDDLIEAMLPDEWRWRSQAEDEHRYEFGPEPKSPAQTR